MTSGVPAPRATDRATVVPAASSRGGLAGIAGGCFALFAATLPLAIAPMNIAAGLCAVATLAVWLTRPGPRWVSSPVDRPAIAWLAAMGLATALAADPAASVPGLGKGLIPAATGLAAWHATDRRRGAAAIAALLAVGSIAALWGCARFFAAGGKFPARAIGFSGSWMTFGLQMMVLVSLAIGIAIAAPSRAWRAGAIAAGLAGAAAVALSFTRCAWLGLAAAIAAILGLRRPWALILLALAVAVTTLALPGDFGDRLRSAFDPAHPSSRERAMMWQAGARLFRDHPVTGVGLVNLRPLLDRYRSPMASEHPAHLHDSYLQAAVTTGAIGLVAFLALCVGLLRASGSGPPGLRRGRGLAAGVRLGVTAGVAGLLVAALFDHAFGDEPLLFLIFTLAGIAWASRGWSEGPDAGAPAPHPRGSHPA